MHAKKLLTLTTLAGALVLGLAAPAGAEVSVVKDPRRDTPKHVGYGDITQVRINHGLGALRTTLRTRITDLTMLYVDTDPDDSGPEYLVTIGAEVPKPAVWKVEDFSRSEVVGDDDGLYADKTCQLPRAQKIRKKGGASLGYHFDVPRRCLGNPATVRVSLQVAMDQPGTTSDWAPARETFGPWTVSGPVDQGR